MTKEKKSYAEKRAEAIRELSSLRKYLLSKNCSVEVINYAYNLKKQFNL